jgi:hypothetical protein
MHGDRAWMMPLSGDRHLGHGPSAVEAPHRGVGPFLREHGVEMNLVMHFDHRRRRKFSRAVAAFLELLEGGPVGQHSD